MTPSAAGPQVHSVTGDQGEGARGDHFLDVHTPAGSTDSMQLMPLGLQVLSCHTYPGFSREGRLRFLKNVKWPHILHWELLQYVFKNMMRIHRVWPSNTFVSYTWVADSQFVTFLGFLSTLWHVPHFLMANAHQCSVSLGHWPPFLPLLSSPVSLSCISPCSAGAELPLQASSS